MDKLSGVLIGAAIVIAIISFLFVNHGTDIVSINNKSIVTNPTNTSLNNTDLTNNSVNVTNTANLTIEINNSIYKPSILTIKKGQTVTWINKDKTTHTITSDSGTELSSRILMENQTYEHKFQFDGTYEYHCEINKSMKAKVIVE